MYTVSNYSMVIQVSSNLEPTVAYSEDVSNPVVEEVSSSDHNEPSMTLGETLSVKQINNTSNPSVKEIQSLVGGTDIKVQWYSYWQGVYMSIHSASVSKSLYISCL